MVSGFVGTCSPSTQFLCHQDGSPLTRFQFTSLFKKCLLAAGENPSSYGTHSFRIGAATEEVWAGEVMRLGRWRSRCYVGCFLNVVFLLGAPEVWLVGHSYICRAAERAEDCPGGQSLGYFGVRVTWRGHRGLRWAQVLGEVVGISQVAQAPVVLVLHVGGNYLCSVPAGELMSLMKADLSRFYGFFHSLTVVWSEIVPRSVWRGARDLGAIEGPRRTVNARMSRFVLYRGGVVVRHRELEGDNRSLL